MNRLFFVLVLLVAGVACLGFYLGWFAVASDNTDGKGRITLTVDKEKIKEDENKALEKVKDLGGHAKDKVEATTDKSKD
jgi:hypothetical protein